MGKCVCIAEVEDGKKIVVINNILFKGKRKIDWKEVEKYLKGNECKGEGKCRTRFALPVFTKNGDVERYNVFCVIMLIRHAGNGKKYLYDIIHIKKETSKLFHPDGCTQ